MARKEDAVDVACRQWARERRKTLGLDELDLEREGVKRFGVGVPSSEYVGAVRSTLGKRRELHHFAPGKIEQHFPEVYVEEALEVHRAYRSMPNDLRCVMDVHYVARAPVHLKAQALALSVRSYWNRVGQMKRYVEGWLSAHTRGAQVG